MSKKKIITIAGQPGSGKSSASKGVAAILGYQHFSSGDLMRAIGRENGISDIHEVNLAIEKGLNFDYLVDQRLREIGETENQIVMDSRMAWHWMPDSFKVYLDLELEIAAERILAGIDEFRMAHEHIPEDSMVYAEILKSRLASERRRYEGLYNVNPFNTSQYDLVIDTKQHDQNAVIDMIASAYNNWLKVN